MLKYAVPSVVALVVNALYNIVDQIFIGQGVGTLGNSATNVVFPLTLIITAFSLLLGDGGAAYLSLELGHQNHKKTQKGVNNTIFMAYHYRSVIGIKGVLWTGPLADVLAFLLAFILMIYQLKQMKKEAVKQQ